MRFSGSSSATRTGNERLGSMRGKIASFSPSSMRPSSFVTVSFQLGYAAPSVRISQIFSGVLRMAMAE
ncbi:hypothetical protein D3C83_29390 [compost metagenome]